MLQDYFSFFFQVNTIKRFHEIFDQIPSIARCICSVCAVTSSRCHYFILIQKEASQSFFKVDSCRFLQFETRWGAWNFWSPRRYTRLREREWEREREFRGTKDEESKTDGSCRAVKRFQSNAPRYRRAGRKQRTHHGLRHARAPV